MRARIVDGTGVPFHAIFGKKEHTKNKSNNFSFDEYFHIEKYVNYEFGQTCLKLKLNV